MKKSLLILLALSNFLLFGCVSNQARNSLSLASEGVSTVVVGDLQASKADIHSVLMKVLREHNWNVLDSGNPIVAEQLDGMEHPRIKITVRSGEIFVDATGSSTWGAAYIPLAFIEELRKSMVENLRKTEYDRYNIAD